MTRQTAAEYQATRRAKVRESGDVFLHVPISARAKSQLVCIAARKGLTHRAVIEMLLDAGHKEDDPPKYQGKSK